MCYVLTCLWSVSCTRWRAKTLCLLVPSIIWVQWMNKWDRNYLSHFQMTNESRNSSVERLIALYEISFLGEEHCLAHIESKILSSFLLLGYQLIDWTVASWVFKMSPWQLCRVCPTPMVPTVSKILSRPPPTEAILEKPFEKAFAWGNSRHFPSTHLTV